MIKKILKDACLLAALMILTVFTISILWSGITPEIALVLELFALALLLALFNTLFDKYVTTGILTGYVLKYLAVSCVVILFGFITGWFVRSNFWTAFIYIAIVFAIAYLLDMLTIKNDVAFINQKLHERDTIQ